MDCKEIEKKIPAFISQKMDYETLKEFSRHVASCESCKEELTIQFLVTEGMQRLEEGDAFDLRRELEQRLEDAAKKLKWHRYMRRLIRALEILAVAGLAGTILWMVLG